MMINVNANVECIVRVKKIILGVLAYVFVRAVSIVDNSEIVCSEIVDVKDNVSTKVTNIVPANVTNTLSINFDNKNVRYERE